MPLQQKALLGLFFPFLPFNRHPQHSRLTSHVQFQGSSQCVTRRGKEHGGKGEPSGSVAC